MKGPLEVERGGEGCKGMENHNLICRACELGEAMSFIRVQMSKGMSPGHP